MNRPSDSGSVAGSSTPASRASSSIVAGRTEPSKWRWSSAFGSRVISSRVSIGLLAAPAGAHHHPEDRTGIDRRARVERDAPAVGYPRGALPYRPAQLGVRRGNRIGQDAVRRHPYRPVVHEDRDELAHGATSRKRGP